MSFFESVPELPPPPFDGPERPAWLPQDGMIPGWSPAGLLLIRTDDVAVAVGGVRGYPNGFEFTVHVRLRQRRARHSAQYFDPSAAPLTTSDAGWAIEKAKEALAGVKTLLAASPPERFG